MFGGVGQAMNADPSLDFIFGERVKEEPAKATKLVKHHLAAYPYGTRIDRPDDKDPDWALKLQFNMLHKRAKSVRRYIERNERDNIIIEEAFGNKSTLVLDDCNIDQTSQYFAASKLEKYFTSINLKHVDDGGRPLYRIDEKS